MAVVRDLLNRKGTNIVSVGPTATVLEAARLMNDRSVGGLLVVDEKGALLGIFTERDILRRVVAAGLSPDSTKVSDVFTRDVVTTTPDAPIEQCGAIMSSRRDSKISRNKSEGSSAPNTLCSSSQITPATLSSVRPRCSLIAFTETSLLVRSTITALAMARVNFVTVSGFFST